MCKGFHHCPSPWWWECSIRTGSWAISKWTERIIRTLTPRQAAVRLPWIPESDRRRAVPRVKLGCFNCLSDHHAEVEHFLCIVSTPIAPVWKELTVSLSAKGPLFFLWWGWDYITPIRNKRPIGPRTIKGFKNQNNVAQFSRKWNKLHCFKVKLGKPAVYRILSKNWERLEQCGWIHSFYQVVKVMTV